MRYILPIELTPPSVNGLYKNSRSGRSKTQDYKNWRKAAGYTITPITPIPDGHYSLTIKLPIETKGDIDNRIKSVSDLLVTVGATPDDRHMWSCSIERADINHTEINVRSLV